MNRPRIDESLLLGYLLNSLDDNDLAVIEEAIAADPSVRERLDKLRIDFQGLLDANGTDLPEPPGDLAATTMRAISDGAKRYELGAPSRWAQFCKRFGGVFTPATVPAESGTGMFSNVLELSVLSVCLLVFGFILISNTNFAREQSRRQYCAFQLSNLGVAIREYAFHGKNQVAPEIESSGPLGFAGVYAARLHDRGLLCEEMSLWCPSGQCEDFSVGAGKTVASLPTVEQLMRAGPDSLRVWKGWIGGSYAYNLGVISNGRFCMPRYLSRSTFAILGDAPVLISGKFSWSNHGWNQCNILYEDGRVALKVCGPNVEETDHPYLNRNGELNAGVDDNDSALGPSYMGPLDDVNIIHTNMLRP